MALNDENEPDQLALIPKHRLTTTGYLRDGFVVDDDDTPVDDISEPESDISSVDQIDPEEVLEPLHILKHHKRKPRPPIKIHNIPILSEELKPEEFV